MADGGGIAPSDFPNWKNVHKHFSIWNETEVLNKVLKKIVGEVRQNNGRSAKARFIIIDAQSVKNTDTAEEKGYDAGKKVSGIKRHIAVNTNGLPHAIAVTTANVTDRDGAIEMVTKNKQNLSRLKNSLLDGGYSGEKFAAAIKEILGATVEVVKRSELHKFAVIPKRWVVERSFAWLEKCRRLWKNCERKLSTSLAMVELAFVRLLVKRWWAGS
jgi:transposase